MSEPKKVYVGFHIFTDSDGSLETSEPQRAFTTEAQAIAWKSGYPSKRYSILELTTESADE